MKYWVKMVDINNEIIMNNHKCNLALLLVNGREIYGLALVF